MWSPARLPPSPPGVQRSHPPAATSPNLHFHPSEEPSESKTHPAAPRALPEPQRDAQTPSPGSHLWAAG